MILAGCMTLYSIEITGSFMSYDSCGSYQNSHILVFNAWIKKQYCYIINLILKEILKTIYNWFPLIMYFTICTYTYCSEKGSIDFTSLWKGPWQKRLRTSEMWRKPGLSDLYFLSIRKSKCPNLNQFMVRHVLISINSWLNYLIREFDVI